jgi:hypothetical protein
MLCGLLPSAPGSVLNLGLGVDSSSHSSTSTRTNPTSPSSTRTFVPFIIDLT